MHPDDKEMGDTMANYDRRILVPYLQDVCSAEMLCQKLEQDISYAKAEADKFAGWANTNYEYPNPPDWDKYKNDYNDLIGGIVGLVIFGGPGLALISAGEFIGLIGIALGCIMFFGCCADQKKKNDDAERQYEVAMERYNRIYANQKASREKCSEWRRTSQWWKNKADEWEKKLKEAEKLRTDLYSVNIIPKPYRKIHAAYYLYDYFEGSRETDLDKIINTMLLDVIVQEMGTLIAQNQEIIVNQRMMLAEQARQSRAIAENQQEQMRQIARMEQNQQLQLDYQNMIACNQQVTNFFLAADYLRKN